MSDRDLVERLRKLHTEYNVPDADCQKAADEITSLRAREAELVEGLEEVGRLAQGTTSADKNVKAIWEIRKLARALISGGDND